MRVTLYFSPSDTCSADDSRSGGVLSHDDVFKKESMKQHDRHFQWVSNQKKKSCKVVSICAAAVNIAPAAQIYEEEACGAVL